MSPQRNRPPVRYYVLAALVASGAQFFLNTLFYRLTWQLHWVHFERPALLTELLFAQYVSYGVLVTLLYPMGFTGGRVLNEGLRFGALTGALAVVPVGLSIRAAWEVPLSLGFYLTCFNGAASGAVTGMLVAAIHRQTRPAAEDAGA